MAKKNTNISGTTSNDINLPVNQYEKITSELKKQAQYQKDIGGSFNGFLDGIKKYKKLKSEIKYLDSAIEKLSSATTKEDLTKLEILKKQRKELEGVELILGNVLKTTDKTRLIYSKMGSETLKGFSKIPNILQKGYGKIKSFGLFEMDKDMKKSILSMGLLSRETDEFRDSIKTAALETNMIGVGVKDLSEIQSSYSDSMGRAITLSKEELKYLGQMSLVTGLGAEATAQMASDFETQGVGAKEVGKFVEKTMNDSHAMGLDSTKTIKTIQNSFKLLNRYNFKEGKAGLAKMAQTVNKLKVDMEFATGFADKLWDVEGAVDMSAQLNVMGGEWANMADPFHLMYMARNDMKGLTEEIAKATQQSVIFNKETGDFDMSTASMHKLKIIAQQTGLAYDDLVTAGKNAKKFSVIKSQLDFTTNNKGLEEYILNKSTLDKNGKAQILVKGEPKFVNQLTNHDKDYLLARSKETATMEERAKQATTFDEQLTFLINQLKVYSLPIVEGINTLVPKIGDMVKKFNEKGGWGEKLTKFAEITGSLAATIGGFILDNPIKSALIYGGAKLTSALIDGAMWINNGLLLSQGFNLGASGGSFGSMLKGVGGNLLKNMSTKGFLGGAGVGLLGAGVNIANDYEVFGKKGSTGHKVAGVLGSAAQWGGTGAAIGSIIPGVGTAIGATVGGIGGALYGAYDEGLFGQSTNDGIFPGNDPNFSKNRAIIQNGKIHPIDNKDDLLAMKPNGIVDNNLNKNNKSITHHTFDDININGELKLILPNNQTTNIDLLKDPQFKRDISRIIISELEKNKNGGKNKG